MGCRVVEWLDEYHSGSFRQAQISFSTRIPNAFPLGDAMTMSTHVCLYNSNHSLHYRDVKSAQPSDPTGTLWMLHIKTIRKLCRNYFSQVKFMVQVNIVFLTEIYLDK